MRNSTFLRAKERFKKLKNNLNLTRTFRLIWSLTNGKVALTLFLIIAESAMMLASIYMFKLLIDVVAQSGLDKEKTFLVLQYLSIAALFGVLYLIFKAVSGYVSQKQALVISEYIDDKIHSAAIELDLGFYESPAYFDTLKRAKDAGPERPNAILTNLVDISKSIMMFIVLGAALVSISWILLVLLTIFILPTLFVRIKFSDKLYEWQRYKTPLERKSSYLSSLIVGDTPVKEIKSYQLGDHLRSLYMKIRIKLLKERLAITKEGYRQEAITTIIATIGFFTCIAYICISTLNGTTTLGDVTLFLVIFPQLFNLLQGLSTGISELYQNNIFLSYLFELLDLKKTMQDVEEPASIPLEKADWIVNKVCFTYPHAKEPVLKDISLKISPGKIVALVGLNGAGKTTLIKLLCRLYDPTSGQVRIGKKDIREFKISEYRKEVSVVFQDFVKYNFSAADNIRFGNIDSASCQERLTGAAMKSGADGYINKFPDGYDTIMGRIFEDGREISIGQWQKLAVARAFYSDSRFLIFDEASSALDARAEQALFTSLRENLEQRGILIISHRLSAVKHADYIYVMEDGKISQEGTHQELLAVSGDYSYLFNQELESQENQDYATRISS